MGDSKLYSAQDIEKLKQKIATYKDTLTTLKTGNSVDDYLAMKIEANGFKTKVSKLEGVMELMNEKQSVQLEEYEQQIRSLSVQMDSLNQTIEGLNQDLSHVKNKLITSDNEEHIENIIAPYNAQYPANIAYATQEKEEDFIEETAPISSMRKSNRPPSYRQLQNLIGNATNIEEDSNEVTPIVSTDIHKDYLEEQQPNKLSFPYTGIHPSQIYNGPYRNVSRATTIHLTNTTKNKAVPINVNENSDPVSSRTTNELANNETVTPDLSLLQTDSEYANNETVTPDLTLLQTDSEYAINETVTPDLSLLQADSEYAINETVTPDLSLLQADSEYAINETVTPYPEEVHNIAIIEEDKAPIEPSNEMKRQQHKNKESLSLFNIFRKKQ
ncbi:hypothetical protein [Sporosarcina sp. BP05]|uniref:hypothetical protein n=1 Tax=Sporosarcina sp. BP05 TaxID=2758726 RepID=UPI0016469C3C|nr:hypothetical protein [Sporosarcina sp. BP05]